MDVRHELHSRILTASSCQLQAIQGSLGMWGKGCMPAGHGSRLALSPDPSALATYMEASEPKNLQTMNEPL